MRLFWRNEPRATTSALDPNEIIDPGNIHLDNSSSLRPKPAKPTPESSRADAHTPPDLAFAAVPVLPARTSRHRNRNRRTHLPAAVRPGDDLKEMTVGVLEVHPAAAVVAVDFVGSVLARVGPVLEPSPADAGEDLVEVVFAY